MTDLVVDAASLKAKFFDIYGSRNPVLEIDDGNDSDDLAWHAAYWLQFYAEMHRMDGDSTWLEMAFAGIDHIWDSTDKARQDRGELRTPLNPPYGEAPTLWISDLRGEGAPLWSRLNGSERQSLPLITGQITWGISFVVDYVLTNRISAYESKARSHLEPLAATLLLHDDQWCLDRNRDGQIPGAFHYKNDKAEGTPKLIPTPNDEIFGSSVYRDTAGTWSNANAFNQNFVWGLAAFLTARHTPEGIAEFSNRITILSDFIRVWWYEVNGAYMWPYTEDGKKEDINHAHTDVGLIWRSPAFTNAERQKVARAYKNWYLGNGQVSALLDGTGGVATGPHHAYACLEWGELVEYETGLWDALCAVYNKQIGTNPTWSVPFLAGAKLARVEALGTIPTLENSAPDPGPDPGPDPTPPPEPVPGPITVEVEFELFTQQATSLTGATITALLDDLVFDPSNEMVIMPILQQATTDSAGIATMHLWPNELGARETHYIIAVRSNQGTFDAGRYQVPLFDEDGNRLSKIKAQQLIPYQPDPDPA